MAECIDRQVAIEQIKAEWAKLPLSETTGFGILMRVLTSIPAANVRPVVRGKWVKARGSWCTPGGDPVWECSECGKGLHVYGIEHSTYGSDVSDGQWVACPNCGADMRPEPPKEEE